MTNRYGRRVLTVPNIGRLLPALAVIASLTLAGCSGLKETLGLERQAPDEFSVVEINPLTVPPDLQNLSQPQTANSYQPATDTARDSAEKLLLGDAAANGAPEIDNADAALLNSAGADKMNGDVRAQLQAEDAARRAEQQESKGFLDSLLLRQQDKQPEEPIIDPREEMQQRREPQIEAE